jgi:succinate dehydrogenase / fumarate reductase flavoprotein subunit
MHTRHELLDVVLCDGRARGIVARDLVTGETRSYPADAVVLATGGYSNVYFLSTNAMGCNVTAVWRAYKRGAAFANPCFTQIHPTCIPATAEHQSKLTLMSESLRNDGRVWVPRSADETRDANDVPEADRYYFLEELYPRFGNLVPRDVASRAAKHVCDDGLGVGSTGRAVYMDFRDAIAQRGEREIESRYGNLFELYEQITGESPWNVPMRIYPAPHYSMGGLWVDYTLQTTVPGLFAIGESNFSDHGANRLGASAMMQCLADGYFVLPHTMTDYLAGLEQPHADPLHPAFATAEADVDARLQQLLAVDGSTPTSYFHRELGKLMLDACGVARSAPGLEKALAEIPAIRESFWSDLKVGGDARSLNQSLEYAGRVADFLELGELMCRDALERDESCGCHLREEHQGADGEPVRNDAEFANAAVWEFAGPDAPAIKHVEQLEFNEIKPKARSYR